MLSFPPLVKKWTVKSEATWPGAENTRKTKLKTRLDQNYSGDFIEELKVTLGDNFDTFEQAMQPRVNPRQTRGRPAAPLGPGPDGEPRRLSEVPIQPSVSLKRADAGAGAKGDGALASTTRSLSGTLSKSRYLEFAHSPWGLTPAHLYEDPEGMASFAEWREKYGQPNARQDPLSNLGPRPLYTQHEALGKRVCGEQTMVTRMKKGFLTR